MIVRDRIRDRLNEVDEIMIGLKIDVRIQALIYDRRVLIDEGNLKSVSTEFLNLMMNLLNHIMPWRR